MIMQKENPFDPDFEVGPQCQFCQHWDGVGVGDGLGFCCANPPVLNGLLPNPIMGIDYEEGVWPKTGANDFCGRFENAYPDEENDDNANKN
jgi:hypothetical protein